jgi:hypothetical protein
MSELDDLFAQLPIDRIAASFGIDEDTARNAIGASLPALLGGMEANAQDEGGAQSLEEALSQHVDRLGDGPIDIDGIDTDDGDKIVGHIFGDQTDQVAQHLGGMGGGLSGGLIRKMLPMLAPILMGYIAKRMRGPQQQQQQQQASSGGGLGDLLGGLLRGGMGGNSGGGGMFGGGGGGGGGILDMLGGLLGGGRR